MQPIDMPPSGLLDVSRIGRHPPFSKPFNEMVNRVQTFDPAPSRQDGSLGGPLIPRSNPPDAAPSRSKLHVTRDGHAAVNGSMLSHSCTRRPIIKTRDNREPGTSTLKDISKFAMPPAGAPIERSRSYLGAMTRLNDIHGGLLSFAKGYEWLGFSRCRKRDKTGWVFREWLPAASEVRLMGDFNSWNSESHPLQRETRDSLTGLTPLSHFETHKFTPPNFNAAVCDDDPKNDGSREDITTGVWRIFIPDREDGSWVVQHRCKIRVYIRGEDGTWFDRVPAWCRVYWQAPSTGLFDGVVWCPPIREKYEICNRVPCKKSNSNNIKPPLLLYEAHIGISHLEPRIGTYMWFRDQVLPRIEVMGYNAVLLSAVLEHPVYSNFGFHVTNYFAISSRFGTPEEFKALVDSAHERGISVILDIPHSHASSNVLDGLNKIDGSETGYFGLGEVGHHRPWDGRIFDYKKTEVLRYLLSSLRWLLEEYYIDGFRFTGVTSMLYKNHAIFRQSSFGVNKLDARQDELNETAILYLMLANKLVHECGSGITIASDISAFASLCAPQDKGGLGFDYHYRLDIAAKWWEQLSRPLDEHWCLSEIVSSLVSTSVQEPCIVSIEDADLNRVGQRPLLIAMFSWESLHTHAVGGVAPHVTELAAGLSRLGHSVHVFTRSTGMHAAHAVHYGVQYHECCFELNFDFVQEMTNMCNAFVWCMKQTEDALGREFDICHAHDWLTAEAVIQCKRAGRRCVMTMHSTEFGRCGNNAYGGKSKQIRDAEGSGCAIADRVVCVSGVLADEVKSQYGVHENKLKVIYNGIHCEQFDSDGTDAGDVKVQYGIGVMDPMFLFVGRLVIQKGPDLLLEAIPHVLRVRQDAKFTFVGDGHMKDELQKRANHLGIGSSVRFAGKQGGAVLKHLFRSCDAVVVPSRNEPFGIVVLEAWSSSKPVVATTCGGPRDFVSANEDGILVDPNAGSIAWGCCEIMKNFEHSQWMGSRGRVKAAFSFGWDTIARITSELYYEQCSLADAAPCVHAHGNESVAFRLMGAAMYDHMTIFDNDDRVKRGLSLHKLLRLVTASIGGDGYLTFMGNEFAHPEWIDMPRHCNQHSYHHARRRWDLADDKQLKFKHFQMFEACLLGLKPLLNWRHPYKPTIKYCNDVEKIVVAERGDTLLIFNFHPTMYYREFKVTSSFSEPMIIVLDTDEERFGGGGQLTRRHKQPYSPSRTGEDFGYCFDIDLPSRCGVAMTKASTKFEDWTCRGNHKILSMDADDLIYALNEGGKLQTLLLLARDQPHTMIT